VGGQSFTVESARPRGRLLALRLAGVATVAAAEPLRGAYLEVPAAEVAALPEGQHYHWELLGMAVVDPAGRPLGSIVDVLEYPANDVYVVRGDGEELLVPAVREVVLEVDAAAERMVVDLPEEVILR
jgi:16S rRNA processing protein RimM